MLALRKAMGNSHPFIVENGAAVCIPRGYFPELDMPVCEYDGEAFHQVLLTTDYQTLRKQVTQWQNAGYSIVGFGDMTAAEVSAHTGLSLTQAHQAKQRSGTEPMLWRGDDPQWQSLQQQAKKNNLRLVKGGRFWHLMGHFDKADGVNWLRPWFEKQAGGHSLFTVALGDSPNDREMLATADVGIVIPVPDSQSLTVPGAHRLLTAPFPGPRGWQQALLPLLTEEENIHG